MSERRGGGLIESLLIVVSILAAFAIDAWWADHQERTEEKRILVSLRTEFQANADQIPWFIRNHDESVDSAGSMILGFREAGPDASTMVHYSVLDAITSHSSYDPLRGVLDAVFQSGELRYLQNPLIREKLASWPTIVADATENEVVLRTIWGPKLNELLMQQVDFSMVSDLYRKCQNPGDDEICARGEFSLRPSLELIGHLDQIVNWAAEASRELKLAETEARMIVELLDQELASH